VESLLYEDLIHRRRTYDMGASSLNDVHWPIQKCKSVLPLAKMSPY